MKLLFTLLGKHPHVGGISTHLNNLTTGLEKFGHFIKIISNTSSFLSSFLTVAVSDLPSWLLSSLNLSEGIFYRISQRKRIFASQFDTELKKSRKWNIINTEDVFSFNAVQQRLQKANFHIPVVLTLHGYALREYESNYSTSLNQRVKGWIMNQEKEAYRTASLIVTVDNRIRDYVLSLNKRINVFVIKNSVNIDQFYSCSESQKHLVRKKFNLPKEIFLIFCPRRLVPKNGVVYAVEAAKILKRIAPKGFKFLLLIAGEGPRRGIIKRKIGRYNLNNQIKLLGSIPHQKIREYYWNSDVITIPSVSHKGVEEATSISALEGMACGIPVVASNIGGLKEIIKNGETGFLVEQKNPRELAEKFLLLTQNKNIHQKMRKKMIKFVKKNHSHMVIAKRFEQLYKSLL